MVDIARAEALLEGAVAAASAAGDAAMEIYRSDFTVETKADRSPVTAADRAAEAIIVEALATLSPATPVVAEEAVSEGRVPEVGDAPFWLVDPLDGTREFLDRNGEFTVNIALIADQRPALGVVLAPALGICYAGIVGAGAWRAKGDEERQPIATRQPPADGLVIAASRRHGDPAQMEKFLNGRPVAEYRSAGSSLKFCLVATGEVDVYPRFGRTMEWDTAAGQAVLAAAGGRVDTVDGVPLTYAKPGFENPHFVAWGTATG